MEMRKLVDANEMNIRTMYGHARSVQQAQNGLLRVCDALSDDARLLRQALREECPERAHEIVEVPRPPLPPKQNQLPPLEELLPPPGPNADASNNDASQHMETALSLLSTVASHKAETAAAQPDSRDNGGSDAGSNDQDSNQGSNGSNQGSSNMGTEDTVLAHSNSNSNGNGSSHSKESPDEADSRDGNGSSHGSDSGDVNAHAMSNGGSESNGSGDGKDGGKGSSNGDSDSNGESNGESMPICDGIAGAGAWRSGSDSSTPPHEVDIEPPQNQVVGAGKRKR